MILINEATEYVRLDWLLRSVMPVAPGIPYELALDFARKNYANFARKSRVLRTEQTFDLQKGVDDYYFYAVSGFSVGQVFCVTREGFYTNSYSVIDNKGVRLHNKPSKDISGGLVVSLILHPISTSNQLPATLEQEYGSGIAEGIKSDVYRIPKKPWTDMGAANDSRREFNRTILNAKNAADVGRKTSGTTLNVPRWL